MGLFMHRDAGANKAAELHPLPHAFRPPEFAPLTGEGECEICGRERESIVHALQMVVQGVPEKVMQMAAPVAPPKAEVVEAPSEMHWSD